MTYGRVYVASVAMGAKDEHTLKAFLEAEAYDGPVAHHCLQPLHRPRHRHDHRHVQPESRGRERPMAALPHTTRIARLHGENPLTLDSRAAYT